MGANQSYETDYNDVISASQERRHIDGGDQNKKRKAKPAAPHRPTVTAVTHNAVSLSWLPPRHTLHAIIAYTVEICKPRQAKNWLTLTKNCQGTHYDARHLDSDTEYAFRVRAENIFGTGKHSAPSDIVTTKIFEMTSDLNCYISPSPSSLSPVSPVSPFIGCGFPKSVSYDSSLVEGADSVFVCNGENGMVKSPSLPVDSSSGLNSSSSSLHIMNQYGSLKRRHSFNVQLDGRVSSILNHSDRFYSTNSINSSTSTIVVNGSTGNITTNNNDTDNAKRRSNGRSSMLRNNLHRTSFQTHRTTAKPILLPGAGSNSLDRLKESRVSLKSSSGDVTGSQSTLPRQRGSVNRNRKCRESRSSLGSTASDTNTNTSSTSSSKEDNNNGACQGSRLSLQSVLSDVTMSNNSQSSDEPPSRPISFSDLGENNTELGSFLNSSNDDSRESTRIHDDGRFGLDNEKTIKIDGFDNNCVNEDDDDIYRLKHDLKNMEITEEKLKYHDLTLLDFSDETMRLNNNLNPKDYYQTLDNPWEKVTNTNSVNSVSENIMAAPFSDDIKIALNAKNNFGDVTSAYRSATHNWGFGDGCHERDDFRTLRSVLQSNHMIVKQSRSMPEVVGVVYGEGGGTRTLTRGKLTTIEDEDEEEEAVRVTTL